MLEILCSILSDVSISGASLLEHTYGKYLGKSQIMVLDLG